MTRAVLFLTLAASLSGCGGAEPPRFTPASGDRASSPPGDRRAVEKASREATVPKNIETH